MDYFPSKLALGSAFCNRVSERAQLKELIDLNRHVVLASPRRYGKSSLVHKVVEDISLPFASIDLFLALDDQTVTKRIIDGVSALISQIMPVNQKAITAIQNIFTRFKVTLSIAGFELGAVYGPGHDYIDQIYDALSALDKLAKSQNKKVLFFIDEFQDLVSAESSKAIQGAIRNVAQLTQNIVFVFSGSSQHMLLGLFDDKTKPLYMLCDKIFLERIGSEGYKKYMNVAAKKKWQSELKEDVISRILSLTEFHSFYVNMLCSQLWRKENTPDIDDVIAAWEHCYDIEERRIMSELESLTANQVTLLKSLALHATSEPMGQAFLQKTGLSTSSVKSALQVLIKKDYVYLIKKSDPMVSSIKERQYRVLDPLISYALVKYA